MKNLGASVEGAHPINTDGDENPDGNNNMSIFPPIDKHKRYKKPRHPYDNISRSPKNKNDKRKSVPFESDSVGSISDRRKNFYEPFVENVDSSDADDGKDKSLNS